MFNLASIKKRGNYWQARVDYYDNDHKRHFKNKSGFATKREAQIWATEKENQLNKGFKINKDTVLKNGTKRLKSLKYLLLLKIAIK